MLRIVSLAVLVACFSSCTSANSSRTETVPVSGIVNVDGVAAAGVAVTLNSTSSAGKDPLFPTAITEEGGKFAISTYENADGAPEGDYTASFVWPTPGFATQGAELPDRLKGRYSNPTSSTFKVKVEKGKPVDMGKVELTTK